MPRIASSKETKNSQPKKLRVRAKVSKKPSEQPVKQPVQSTVIKNTAPQAVRPITPPEKVIKQGSLAIFNLLGLMFGIIVTIAFVISVYNLVAINSLSKKIDNLEKIDEKVNLLELSLNKKAEYSVDLDLSKPANDDTYLAKNSKRYVIVAYLDPRCSDCLSVANEIKNTYANDFDIIIRNTIDTEEVKQLFCLEGDSLTALIEGQNEKELKQKEGCLEDLVIGKKLEQNAQEVARIGYQSKDFIVLYDLETGNSFLFDSFDNLKQNINKFLDYSNNL